MHPHELLGVRPGASAREVTAAFRRFALGNHPDRGGDPERFRAGAEAYRRLLSAARLGENGAGAPRRADVTFHRRARPGPAALAALVRRARSRLARSRP